MRSAIGVILVGLVISGCAGDVWLKPGATQPDFAKDQSDCEIEVRLGGHLGATRTWTPNAQVLENQCLEKKGWTLHEQKP